MSPIEFEDSSLARQLRALTMPVPPRLAAAVREPRPSSASPRAIGMNGRRPRRGGRLATLVAACAATLLVLTGAAFSSTVADIAQAVLRAAGLTSNQVVAMQGGASNGHLAFNVSGGYADGVTTVIF